METTKAERNATAIEKREPRTDDRKQGEITMKDLFTRVVALETKIELTADRVTRVEKRLSIYILILGVMALLDVAISIAFFVRSFFKYDI